MPVYQDKKSPAFNKNKWYFSTYYTDVYGVRKKYKSKKYSTKTEANKAEIKFLNSEIKETKISFTFQEAFDELIEIKKEFLREQSITKLKSQYRNLIEPYFANTQIDGLTHNSFLKWKKELNGKKLTATYKNKGYKLINTLIDHANKFYDIENKVPKKIGGFKDVNTRKKNINFYDYEEFKKFINVIDEIEWLCFFKILYFCGLRQGEALALCWEDIDFEKKEVSISKTSSSKVKGQLFVINPPKTKGSYRVIPFPETVYEDLKKLKKEQEKIKGYNSKTFVFGFTRPFPETTIQKKKKAYIEKAGTKYLRIHDFRHSCASLLINNGANISIVAKYLGHSDIEMTLNTYTHLFDSKLDEISNLLNKLN